MARLDCRMSEEAQSQGSGPPFQGYFIQVPFVFLDDEYGSNTQCWFPQCWLAVVHGSS